jgi:predicted Zn-dependent peptidase
MTTLKRSTAAAALGLLLAAAGFAQTAQTPPAAAKKKDAGPAPGPVKDVRFPSFEQRTLANGLRVVVIEQHEQPLVSLRLLLDAGKAYEPASKTGLANATAALLTKGTPTRNAQQLAETIDFVGGNLGAFGGTEGAYAQAGVTADQLDLGFELLADVILRPTFPQEEVERWRRQSLSGLQVNLQDAGYLAEAATLKLIFGDYPYGRPGDGTPDSIAGITRDDMVTFHQRFYIPNSSILAIVGDVKPADAFARAERAFGGWKKGEPVQLPAFNVPRRDKPRIVVIDKPDAVQTEIRIGQVGIRQTDPAVYAEDVYNTIVGGNASARLYEEIRRKRGLSYGANSFFLELTQPGFFIASTFTKTESTAEALGLALDVLRGMQKEAVPQDELKFAKTYITGAFPLEIETAEGIAAKVQEALHFGLGREYLETYNDRITKVAAEDVRRFASEVIHPDRMVVVLAGNASGFSEELKKKFGDFEVIPAAEVDLQRADLRKPKAAAAPVSGADQAKGRELLSKAQAALGGKAFLEQKTQIAKGTGSMTPPGAPEPMPIPSVITYRVLPAKERTEIQLPMGTMVQVFDGTNGWMSLGAQSQDTTPQAKEEKAFGLDVLRRAGGEGYTARPLADATVAGKAAQGLEVADPQGHATQFFLDPQTGLLMKLAYTSNGQTSEALYSDFREVNGVKIPFKTQISRNGQPVIEIVYTDVQVNAPVDEALFKKPAS